MEWEQPHLLRAVPKMTLGSASLGCGLPQAHCLALPELTWWPWECRAKTLTSTKNFKGVGLEAGS